MRRLLLLFLLAASPVMAQRIVLISGGTVTANVTDSADFYVTLNQNVTGVTLTSTVTLKGRLNHDEPVGRGERQRPEQHPVYDAEDGRVRPDAQREREHSHGGEAGILQQLAEGEFEIVHGSLNR